MEAVVIGSGRSAVIEGLQSKLSTLKTNREKVPLEVLKSKFAVPYNRLLAEIGEAFRAMTVRSLRGIVVKPDAYAEINMLWNQKYKSIVSHSIYKEYDAEKAQKLIDEFLTEVICQYGED